MASARPPQVAQRLVDAYITGLRQRLPTLCLRQLKCLPGATEHQILRLRQSYPAVPEELQYLLQRVNGTYWEAIQRPTLRNAGAAAKDSATTSMSKAEIPSSSTAAAAAAATATTAAAAAASSTRRSATAAAASFMKSALDGPAHHPVNRERIAVPILGSALGDCPYYLKTVEDILQPFLQPFPPRRKTAPRAPTDDDTEAMNAATTPDAAAGAAPAAPAPAPAPASASAAETPLAPSAAPSARLFSRVRLPADSSIRMIYSDHEIIRGSPPPETATAPAAAAAAVAAPTLADEKLAPPAGAARTRKPVYVDPRISTSTDFGHWLVFADSMLPHHQPWAEEEEEEGHGGAAASAAAAAGPSEAVGRRASVSRLYVDFSPDTAAGGVPGQIIQYSRGEPESFVVIATDFGAYLKQLMANEYEFTEELDGDEEGETSEAEKERAARVQTTSASGAAESARAAGEENADVHVTLTMPSGQPISSSSSSKQG